MVGVVTGKAITGRTHGKAWKYAEEILTHAGMAFDTVAPSALEDGRLNGAGILLIPGMFDLSAAAKTRVESFVTSGGGVLIVGGTGGLDDLIGVGTPEPFDAGFIRIDRTTHPVTKGLHSSLHVFGGYTAVRRKGSSLATLLNTAGEPRPGAAIVEREVGKGRVLFIGPDLCRAVTHIQQGNQVVEDGTPAPDGSAPIDDGILKCEDGMVLDWSRDRVTIGGDAVPAFLHPVADELRALLIKSILHLARTLDLPLPLIWYWPRNLAAVGHLSHDTDGNNPDLAWALLGVTEALDVRSTWCILYPGGYPHHFYEALATRGYERAMHFDSFTGGRETTWSRDNFDFQHGWLARESGETELYSNKNHYTRWEGTLDFYRWCEHKAIRCDETKGPSKRGTIGFPFGGSQPWRPMDDEVGGPRIMDVVEINLLTQDLVITADPGCAEPLLDSVLENYGVAHFLFHPHHVLKPGVAAAIRRVIDGGRERGMEWWTAREIGLHLDARRTVRQTLEVTDRRCLWSLDSPRQNIEATVLVLRTARGGFMKGKGLSIAAGGVKRYGFDFSIAGIEIQKRKTTIEIG